jgi:hypothetical protein
LEATDTVGAVDVPPASMGAAGAFAAAAGAGFALGADDEATSPALALRAASRDLGVDVRPSPAELRAVSAAARSSEDFRTQPSRETFAHPAGALPVDTDTLVPASSDATLRAVLAPRARSTAERFPTRGADLPRCAESRDRSTKPSIEIFAYAPRVSITRIDVPGWTLPIALPLGDARTAAGVVTTRDWASTGTASPTNKAIETNRSTN